MFRAQFRHLKTSLLACAAGASLLASPTLAQQVDANKLLEIMVKKGLVTREEADAMIAEATTSTSAQPAQPPVPAGGVSADGTQTIPYVPQVVRDQIVQQVRAEMTAKAEAEGWAKPGEVAVWDRLVALAVEAASHIVSNTGDTGYAIPDGDRAAPRGDQVPTSFCGMLTELLHRRWQAGRTGVTMLPCELVVRNGDVLRAAITGRAHEQGREAAFVAWLDEACVWANTLVDRIVSEPLSPAGAVAEPYALWAIERQPMLALPFTHPAIVLTDDLDRYERLKLHILNLGHSWLAARWHAEGSAADQTVRAALTDPATRAALDRVMAEEVLPGFAAHGMAGEAKAYIATTLERFANPFLDHRLADIYGGHTAKVEKRIGGFIRWVEGSGKAVAMPELRALAARPG